MASSLTAPLTSKLISEAEKLIRQRRDAGESTSSRIIAQIMQDRGRKNVTQSKVRTVQKGMADYTPQDQHRKSVQTKENTSLVEKETRKRYNAGESTSSRLVAKVLKERGINISERSVLDIQKNMSGIGDIKEFRGKEDKAAKLKAAQEYLKSRNISYDGLIPEKIIRTAAEKKNYEQNQNYKRLYARISEYEKNKSSSEKVKKAAELKARLNADRFLATNPEFLREVEAVKNIGTRPKEKNPVRKSEQRRQTIIRQTPMWALRPAYQVELAATGDDVSRGGSKKNVNIKKIFPDKFESDHIRRLQDRGLHAPFNIQSLTKEQHNIKRGLENRGLLDRAKNLFKFNPSVGPASGLLAENLLEYDPNKGKPFQYLMPDNKSNRARVGGGAIQKPYTSMMGSSLIGVKGRKTISETLRDLLM